MNTVTKRDVLDVPAPPTNEGAALIGMIERAARDPAVDIEKMERLFLMHERMTAQRARSAYLNALAEMQPKLPIIGKRGEISRSSKDASGAKQAAKPTKYAKWEDVVEGITPILAAHGFSLSFRIKQEQRVEVTAVLGHKDGHAEETSMLLGIDDSGAKNNIQGWGSSVSYGKRYTAFALLNIVARGEDDDANASSVVTDAQVAELTKLIGEARADISKVLEWHKIESLSDMPAREFEKARAMLFARKAKIQKDARP